MMLPVCCQCQINGSKHGWHGAGGVGPACSNLTICSEQSDVKSIWGTSPPFSVHCKMLAPELLHVAHDKRALAMIVIKLVRQLLEVRPTSWVWSPIFKNGTELTCLPCVLTFSKRTELLNRVSKASCCMGNWYGSITHGKKLVQTTGLKARWHKYNVRASNNFMRNLNGEAHPAPTKSGNHSGMILIKEYVIKGQDETQHNVLSLCCLLLPLVMNQMGIYDGELLPAKAFSIATKL